MSGQQHELFIARHTYLARAAFGAEAQRMRLRPDDAQYQGLEVNGMSYMALLWQPSNNGRIQCAFASPEKPLTGIHESFFVAANYQEPDAPYVEGVTVARSYVVDDSYYAQFPIERQPTTQTIIQFISTAAEKRKNNSIQPGVARSMTSSSVCERLMVQSMTFENSVEGLSRATNFELPTSSGYKLASVLLSMLHEKTLKQDDPRFQCVQSKGVPSGYAYENDEEYAQVAYNHQTSHITFSHTLKPKETGYHSVTEYRFRPNCLLIDSLPVPLDESDVLGFDMRKACYLFAMNTDMYVHREPQLDPTAATTPECEMAERLILRHINAVALAK